MTHLFHLAGEKFINESIIGSKFSCQLVREGPIIGYGNDHVKSVIPQICGTAFVTGFNTLVVDKHDPFPHGYTVGDIWT